MEPPKKKSKRTVTYRPELTQKFPCLIKSSKGPGFIRCTVCFKDFSIDSGLNDCQRHVDGPRHIQNAKSVNKSLSLAKFSSSSTDKDSSLVEAVTNAEVLFTGFLVEHNIALSAADHPSKLFKSMFCSSQFSARQIIEKYSCGRTKSTHLVKEMARDERANLIEAMQSTPFSIATDASNDKGEKLYPIVVRLFKEKVDVNISTELLSIIEVEGKNSGQNIACALFREFDKKGIPWSNVVAFTSDNANMMIGNKNGCYGHLLKKNDNILLTGCVCHRLHLSAEWASRQLPVNVEQFLIDVYYYIEKNGSRLKSFQDFQLACGLPPSQVHKHCPTRWLSLHQSCVWVLEQWEALENFFSEECKEEKREAETLDAAENKRDRKSKTLESLKSRTMKLYIKYLSFILQEFNSTNLAMQTDKPMIHVQRRVILKFIRKLMQMFLKPCALTGKLVSDVDFKSSYNIHSNTEILVGEQVREYLSKTFSSASQQDFFSHVKKFLTTAVSYMLKNGKLHDEYMKHAEVADISLKEDAKWSSICYFVDRYPSFLKSGFTKDQLHSEFLEYRSLSLPNDINSKPMDEQWRIIGNLKDEVGERSLKCLPTTMMYILAIPHSNAACECIFSIVRKNRTDFRASMSVGTLEDILTLKQTGIACHERKVSSKLLKSCKEATAKALASNQQ